VKRIVNGKKANAVIVRIMEDQSGYQSKQNAKAVTKLVKSIKAKKEKS
jgi:hypothetical protein